MGTNRGALPMSDQIDVSPGTITLATTYTWLSAAITTRQHREVDLYGTMATVGSATSLTLRFDKSDDGSTWYPVLDESTGSPVEKAFTIADFGTTFALTVLAPSAPFMRVRAKVDDITGGPTLALGFLGDGALL